VVSFDQGSWKEVLAKSYSNLPSIISSPIQTRIQETPSAVDPAQKRTAAASCVKQIEACKLTEMMTTLNQTSHFSICEGG
jgi:hypothetical protein